MRLLVTGGAGFIGSNYVRRIVDGSLEGIAELLVLDKLTYAGTLRNFDSIPSNSFEFIQGDICDVTLVEESLKGVDWVFHFAAESHVDRSIQSARIFFETNVVGTQTLLESSVKNDVSRFIHVSTDEVYGSIANGSWSEEFPLSPNSPYSASKAAGDLLIKSYVRTYKIPAIITNCCNNFGPNQYPEKLIPKIIYNILNKKLIPIYGKGKNEREWIYVEDHCNALIKIAEKGIIGENYNIGSGIILNNIQIAEKIISNFKKIIHAKNIKSKIYFVKDRPGHDLRYCLNSSKIKNKLQWKCKSSFNERINETIIWYINKFNNNYFKKKDFKYRIGLNI